jgi:hypothetical protein
VRFYTEDECFLLREQIDNPGPMDRAWEYYAALAEGRI